MKAASILLGLIIIFALRSAYTSWMTGQVIAGSSAKSSACLALAGSTTNVQDGQTFIIGNVRNNCDRKFSNVTIVFKIDRVSRPDEHLPDTFVYAYNRDMKPGETRRFKSVYAIGKISTYRLDGIKAY